MNQNERTCGRCGTPCRIVPAGFSRVKNKEYGAFYKCSSCGFSENVGSQPEKPKKYVAPQPNRTDEVIEVLYMILEEIKKGNERAEKRPSYINPDA